MNPSFVGHDILEVKHCFNSFVFHNHISFIPETDFFLITMGFA